MRSMLLSSFSNMETDEANGACRTVYVSNHRVLDNLFDEVMLYQPSTLFYYLGTLDHQMVMVQPIHEDKSCIKQGSLHGPILFYSKI